MGREDYRDIFSGEALDGHQVGFQRMVRKSGERNGLI